MCTIAGRAVGEEIAVDVIVIAQVNWVGKLSWEDDVGKGSVFDLTDFVFFCFLSKYELPRLYTTKVASGTR